MNGLHERRIACEGLKAGGLMGPEENLHSVLEGRELGEDRPSQLVLQVTPDPCAGMEFRAVGWHPEASASRRPDEGSSGRGTAVAREQDVQAVRTGRGTGIDAPLERLGVQAGQCQAEARARRRRHRAVHVAPLEDVLHGAHGRHTPRGETPSTDRSEADAAFILAAHPHRPAVFGWDDTWPRLAAGGLERGYGLRVFWCGWGAAL
jgi:hypothetical protein